MKCTDKKPKVTGRADPSVMARRYGYTVREWERLSALDKAQQKTTRRLVFVLVAMVAAAAALLYGVYFFGIRSHDYTLRVPFDKDNVIFGIPGDISLSDTAPGFASDLCVTDRDIGGGQLSLDAYSAGLYDMTGTDILYSRDAFTKRSPASLTKIMTTLVTLKYGNLDDIVTVTDTAKDIEYGSSVCDIKTGDQLTLKQLLYGMMIASGNDAAMMIAEHVGGSVPQFVRMMNDEATALGATRTHFTNPHGLTDSEHYTCVYDLYLMFHEAQKYDIFMDIISRTNYYAEYRNAEGTAVAVTWESTNHYFTGEASLPENVIVYGGKTGTTDDAGACLALLAKDLYGNPYLAVILHANDKDQLYVQMNRLLSLIA